MKYVDEFRNPAIVNGMLDAIRVQLKKIEAKRQPKGKKGQKMRPLQLMEFCGGHTHTLFKYGIENLLPDSIEMVHGPGCPVCVLPMGRVDECIQIAERLEVIFTTFGDAMRVPGTKGSLLDARRGAAISEWFIRRWMLWRWQRNIRTERWFSLPWDLRRPCRVRH